MHFFYLKTFFRQKKTELLLLKKYIKVISMKCINQLIILF